MSILKYTAALLLLITTMASANTVQFQTTLSPSQEVGPIAPSTPKSASGIASFSYDEATHVLTYKITYSNLSAAPFMAHFHHGAKGVNGPVIQTLCGAPAPTLLGHCPITKTGFLKGTWKIPAADVPYLLSGNMFVNIHTPLNQKGEIRGQLIPQIYK